MIHSINIYDFNLIIEAIGRQLYLALKTYAEKLGPSIMADESRPLVKWIERERAVVGESDLEDNFVLCKEVILCCMENSLTMSQCKEIPTLADFEAS